ncbi:MAG: LolA family protein [Thermoanaerobaculum sp.]
MRVLLLLLTLLSSPLEQLASTLKAVPAWQAEFSQSFVPAGLSRGSQEHGVFTFAHPSRVRFDYQSDPKRTFAVDGSLARMVDAEAGTCQAVELNEGSWASLPLVALTDPGALRAFFVVQEQKDTITLVPRQKSPELTRVVVHLGANGLPQDVWVEDGSGNQNRFRFSRWKAQKAVARELFSPSLPGQSPCFPGGDNPRPQR